jgi:hypothetical protein
MLVPTSFADARSMDCEIRFLEASVLTGYNPVNLGILTVPVVFPITTFPVPPLAIFTAFAPAPVPTLTVCASVEEPSVMSPVCAVPPILIVPATVEAPTVYVEPPTPSRLKFPVPTFWLIPVVPVVFPIDITLPPAVPLAMLTAPVDVPVLILVGWLLLTFRFIPPVHELMSVVLEVLPKPTLLVPVKLVPIFMF